MGVIVVPKKPSRILKMKIALVLISTLFAVSAYAAKAPASSPAMLEKGKAVFTVNCATCHGDTGDGKGPAGQYMNPKPRHFVTDAFKGKDGKGKIKKPTVQQVFDAVTAGVTGTSMTAFAHLSEEDRWAVSYYVLSLRNKK